MPKGIKNKSPEARLRCGIERKAQKHRTDDLGCVDGTRVQVGRRELSAEAGTEFTWR